MSSIGKRYAQALLANLGAEPVDAVLADLKAFGAMLEQVPELGQVIENPGIPAEVKGRLVRELAKRSGLRDVSIRFVLLTIEHRRLRQWEEIVAAFSAIRDEKAGVQRAQVVSARPLNERARKEMSARLASIFGRAVELEARVSGELLGGIQLHVGSTVYDGSVAGALKSVHQDLVKG
jgi:F-type H+-transporting ATPase subunit delta